MKIPFNKPFIVGKELYYIAEATLKNQRLAGAGPFTRMCEQWIENQLGSCRALLTPSCTAALEMAAILCDLKPGAEVIMPSFTFVSTANAFVLRGATPVFVDIRYDTLNMDERQIEGAITSRTRAIVPVHYAGVACEMDVITELASRYDLLVVEDSAHALLSSYKSRRLGSIGDFGCLSFHETKNIICGEGGALLVNKRQFADRAGIIRDKGTNRDEFFNGRASKYTWVDIGSSYLPSEITAAFLWAQLEKAQEIINKRVSLAENYMELLGPMAERGLLELPRPPQGNSTNGHIFYILLKSTATRDALIEHLKARSVTAIFHYVPLHSSPVGNRIGKTHGHMAVTDDVSSRLLRLPLFYQMGKDEIRVVVKFIGEFFGI